jgi:histidine triad (HIT) family protein
LARSPGRTYNQISPMPRYCVFCRIATGEEPADVIYEDDEFLVIRNLLRWAPVMLLVMRKDHVTQYEFWQDMSEAGRIAADVGAIHCPNGFRLLSNFGYDAMQSQEHGHLHIVGGVHLGPYA